MEDEKTDIQNSMQEETVMISGAHIILRYAENETPALASTLQNFLFRFYTENLHKN